MCKELKRKCLSAFFYAMQYGFSELSENVVLYFCCNKLNAIRSTKNYKKDSCSHDTFKECLYIKLDPPNKCYLT